MTMLRKEAVGDYQIGIWNVTRQGSSWLAVACGPGALGDRGPQKFASLAAAYYELTGEPLGSGDLRAAHKRFQRRVKPGGLALTHLAHGNPVGRGGGTSWDFRGGPDCPCRARS